MGPSLFTVARKFDLHFLFQLRGRLLGLGDTTGELHLDFRGTESLEKPLLFDCLLALWMSAITSSSLVDSSCTSHVRKFRDFSKSLGEAAYVLLSLLLRLHHEVFGLIARP